MEEKSTEVSISKNSKHFSLHIEIHSKKNQRNFDVDKSQNMSHSQKRLLKYANNYADWTDLMNGIGISVGFFCLVRLQLTLDRLQMDLNWFDFGLFVRNSLVKLDMYWFDQIYEYSTCGCVDSFGKSNVQIYFGKQLARLLARAQVEHIWWYDACVYGNMCVEWALAKHGGRVARSLARSFVCSLCSMCAKSLSGQWSWMGDSG